MIEIETLKFRQKCRECVYFPHFFPKFYPKIYHGFYPKFFPTLYRIVALTFSEILLHCIIICPYIFRCEASLLVGLSVACMLVCMCHL